MLVKLLTARCKRAVHDSLTFALPKVKVSVNEGVVKGVVEKLPESGQKFLRFSGIPYAKPPIHELRFRSPQKLQKFTQDEVDCTRERDACYHKSAFHGKFIGSEDCLNLNLYVPESASSSNKLPVMVFIHGGGLAFDSNSRDFYSPEYLLTEDVIIVTINYRLHALGFLSLPREGISGNAGLKDQQMALEWVYDNIDNFNGDHKSICLFGESAGAACVHLHTMNPNSRKFIKTAICQSNNAFCDWLFQKDPLDKTKRLAKLLGASGNSDQDSLEALIRATPKEIYDNVMKAIDPNCDELRRNLPFVFKPIIEQESDDAFLTQPPADLLKNFKNQINIPIMFGLNDGDGMTMANYYRNKKLPLFDADHVRMVPLSLNIDPMSDEAKKLGKEIKEFYFGEKPIDEKALPEFVKMMTDFQFTVPQTMSNELHARYQSGGKQYVYEFCYDGELNVFKELLKMTEVRGACHFDEIFYLFDCKLVGMNVSENSPAGKMRRTMCKMWTNFAKFGNPTPDGENDLPFKWNPVRSAESSNHINIDYLRIGDSIEMKENLYKTRTDFWRQIYEKYNSGLTNPKF